MPPLPGAPRDTVTPQPEAATHGSKPARTPWSGMFGARMRILMYHGVGVADFPAAAFRRQLARLAARYEMLSIEQALQALASDRLPRRAQMLLTFDDGLRNNLQVAYPALVAMNLPAVFYVCPGLIESRAWLWNHEARARLHALAADQRERLAADVGAPSAQVEPWVDWMKWLPVARCGEVLAMLRERTSSFTPSDEQRRRYDLMDWNELATLDPRIVTIGSHTLTHPIMTGLESDQLAHEVQASRSWLEDRLKRPVRHFCYPNGANNPAVRRVVAAAYDSAVSTDKGYARAGDDPHGLRRIGATPKRANMLWRLHRRYPAA
jgi:peptidoglycan/xylan/chitin deacetylase (PgdA/CDA1 family)